MSRIPESQMTYSPMTILNIPVTHFLKLWMGNTIMVGSLSQYPLLVSDEIARVDKGNIWTT